MHNLFTNDDINWTYLFIFVEFIKEKTIKNLSTQSERRQFGASAGILEFDNNFRSCG